MKRVLSVALVMVVDGCAEPQASVAIAMDVDPSLAAPTAKSATSSRSWFALVVPRFTVDVETSVAGRIADLAVGLGARVEAGDTIVVLDNTDLRLVLRLAEGHARSARGRLSDAGHTRALSKYRARQAAELGDYVSADDRSESKYELRRATAATSSAQGELAAQRAEVDRLRAQLDALTVRAPFAAEVAAIYRDPGQSVLADEPLVRLVSTEQVVRFAVTEQDVGDIFLGAAIEFVAEDERITATGTVMALAPEVDSARMVIVEAAIAGDGTSARLRAGTHGHVRVRKQ